MTKNEITNDAAKLAKALALEFFAKHPGQARSADVLKAASVAAVEFMLTKAGA